MKRSLPNKEAVNLSLAFCCVVFIPLSIWLTRPRPLSAASAGELARLACDARQDEIITQMSRRSAAMLAAESADKAEKPAVRWQKIRASLGAAGAGADEAAAVTRLAQNDLAQEWPVLAERGFLRGKSVWIVIGSTPSYAGPSGTPICGPSSAVLLQAKLQKYGATARAVVVSAQAPYHVLH